jgi:glycosyltransferase involved in cell wall biosynthesis
VRVALSLLTYVPGAVGGSETYVTELLRALPDAGGDISLLLNPAAEGAFPGVPATAVGPRGAGAAAKAGRLVASKLRPGAFRRPLGDADVVHYPLTVPLPSAPGRWVTTLHDVQHLDLPQLFGYAMRWYRSHTYDRAAREADMVVVPSAFVRDRAVSALGLDPGRVAVIPHGVDHARFRPGSDARERFLLYPARSWPHKNHATLLDAFELLRRDEPELRLVLTGAGTAAFGGRPGVEALGLVSGDELLSLYRRAACLVFPSRYEGFGLPPLEAMACGTPVAAARAASIPEVCGDAAILFDPADARAIAAGVREALGRAHELGLLGLAHAASFTWDRSAAAHVDAYRAAAA